MMPMKYIFSSILITLIGGLLHSCIKPDNDPFIEKDLQVQGILIAGNDLQEIRIYEFGSGKEVSDAQVKICNSQTCFDLTVSSPGVYHSPIALQVYPDSIYQLEIEWQDNIITSEAKIPSAMSWITLENTILTVDTLNAGQPLFTADWAGDEQSAFVLHLAIQDGDSPMINYNLPNFSFENDYSLPISNSSITLQDLYFTHYGPYKFNVYAIDKTYQEVFFYQPQIQQIQPEEGMDNITGAFGVFVGVNKLSVDLLVN